VIFFPTLLVCLPNNASSSGLTVLLVVPPVRLPRENEVVEEEEGEEGYCVLKGSLSEQYKNERTARGPTVTQFAAKQRK